MAEISDAGGMFEAVRTGLVQGRIGESAMAFQNRVETGEQKIVGVNAYQTGISHPMTAEERPAPALMEAQIDRLRAFKRERSQSAAQTGLDQLAAAAAGDGNIFERLINAVEAGATHGEICACLRRELGDGEPLVAA
jgi:methylmalonyl-CoA mutase N-terminal domain/subunit